MHFRSTNQFVHYLFEQTDMAEPTKEIVAKAIDNTPPDYMERSLAQRAPGGAGAGSTFLQPQTPESLKAADWKPLTHNPEAIKAPAQAFEADIPGKLGAADIGDYPSELQAVIQPAHGGKGVDRTTGKLMAELAAVLPAGMPEVSFTTMILGPTQSDPNKLQVWTFHPGAPSAQGTPLFLDDMKKEFGTEDDRILTTVGKAKELGFVTIKHVDSLPAGKEEEKAAPGSLLEGFTLRRSRRHKEF